MIATRTRAILGRERRGERVFWAILAAGFVACAIAAGSLMRPATLISAPPVESRGSDLQATVAYGDYFDGSAELAASLAGARAVGPLRVALTLPLPTAEGMPVYRGYVENSEPSNLTNVRMELTFTDGSTMTYLISAALRPGDRTTFEFRATRADVSGQPKFRYFMYQ